MVLEAIAPFQGTGNERLEIDGPDVRLSPRIALAIAMALQELGTNAVKYGALCNETGRVAITWSMTWQANGTQLRVVWQETGGPPVVEPSRRGFGTRLIERSLAQELDGDVTIAFAPAGVVCTIDAPLSTRANPRGETRGPEAAECAASSGREPGLLPRDDLADLVAIDGLVLEQCLRQGIERIAVVLDAGLRSLIHLVDDAADFLLDFARKALARMRDPNHADGRAHAPFGDHLGDDIGGVSDIAGRSRRHLLRPNTTSSAARPPMATIRSASSFSTRDAEAVVIGQAHDEAERLAVRNDGGAMHLVGSRQQAGAESVPASWTATSRRSSLLITSDRRSRPMRILFRAASRCSRLTSPTPSRAAKIAASFRRLPRSAPENPACPWRWKSC